jgi:putative ABC transport system permease protein
MRVSVLALAVLVAAVSFVLLTGAAKTSSLEVQGTVKSNFRPAYDILVRPKGSFTELERSAGLVRSNYLSGIFGGISFRQYRQVLRTRDVEVAAPIANLGYVVPFARYQLSLNKYLTRAPLQILRIRGIWKASGGSRFPASSSYVYVTSRPAHLANGLLELTLPGRRLARPCLGLPTANNNNPPTGPFWQATQYGSYIECFSTRSPNIRSGSYAGRGVGILATAQFPMLLSAIDPVQENQLLHFNRTIVHGRPLRETDRAFLDRSCIACGPAIPTIASTRTYVDETLEFQVERLHVPAPESHVATVLDSIRAPQLLDRLRGPVVGSKTIHAGPLYEALLTQLTKPRFFGIASYWVSSSARYCLVGVNHVTPLTVKNPSTVWKSPNFQGGYFPAPPDNQDTQFRRIEGHPGSMTPRGPLSAGIKLVGRFDPRRLPGFSALSAVPLESYYPPKVEPANAASAHVLGGRPLLPDANLGGYVTQPPFLLTNLESLRRFLGKFTPPKGYEVQDKYPIFQHANTRAPISVIRVRVKGVKGPDPLSLERIKVVAQEIHDETGLDVDITAGSSPHPLLVSLPAGKFGRPPLLLREGWSKKGVSVSFLRALDRKDALLFGLILVICGFFLGNGALAAVRARRAEIGVLRTLGWPGRSIFAAILSELALVGLLAGVAGVALALGLVALLDLHLALWRALLVLPLALLLALVAGVLPALLASRGQPLDAMRPPVAVRSRLGHVRSLLALAFVNLRRSPARTLLGAAGLFVGVAALTVLVGIERGFHGTLAGPCSAMRSACRSVAPTLSRLR